MFHQLEPRVKAHVVLALLCDALRVTLKHLLKRHSAIVPPNPKCGFRLPTTDGRDPSARITELTAEQKSLLQQLSIRLPEQCGLNRKCSADLTIA